MEILTDLIPLLYRKGPINGVNISFVCNFQGTDPSSNELVVRPQNKRSLGWLGTF